MKSIINISLTGFLFFGCTKAGKNISVRGRVYNAVTNEGISNIEIRLLKDEVTPSLSGGSEAVKSVYTDANGFYELDHASIGSRYVGCFLDNDQYYRIGWIYEGENIGKHTTFVNKGKYTYLDYQVVPFGQYNAHVENINCSGSTDSMQLRKKYQYDDYGQYWSPYRVGCYNSTSTQPLTLPMGYYYFETKVTRSGVTNYVYDTVFVDETGTSFLEILY